MRFAPLLVGPLTGFGLFASSALAQWPSEVLIPLPNGWTAYNAEIHAGDINLDGRTDVVYANHSDGAVQWLENDAAGTWASHPVATLGQYLNQCVLLDVNRDGRLDLVPLEMTCNRPGLPLIPGPERSE